MFRGLDRAEPQAGAADSHSGEAAAEDVIDNDHQIEFLMNEDFDVGEAEGEAEAESEGGC